MAEDLAQPVPQHAEKLAPTQKHLRQGAFTALVRAWKDRLEPLQKDRALIRFQLMATAIFEITTACVPRYFQPVHEVQPERAAYHLLPPAVCRRPAPAAYLRTPIHSAPDRQPDRILPVERANWIHFG